MIINRRLLAIIVITIIVLCLLSFSYFLINNNKTNLFPNNNITPIVNKPTKENVATVTPEKVRQGEIIEINNRTVTIKENGTATTFQLSPNLLVQTPATSSSIPTRTTRSNLTNIKKGELIGFKTERQGDEDIIIYLLPIAKVNK